MLSIVMTGSSFALLDALQLAEVFVVRLLIGAVEDRVLALMQLVDIVVVIVHDVLIEHRERKNADIRALVGNTLHIDEDIEEGKTRIHRALAVAHAADVIGAQRGNEVIHDLLDRLDLARGLVVRRAESAVGVVEDLAECLPEHRKLLMRHRRQARIALDELLRVLRQVHGVVADALKLAEALDVIVQKVVRVARRHMGRKADEIVVHVVGELVDMLFILVDDIDRMAVVLVEHIHRAHHARAGQARHGRDGLARAREGDGGGGEELFIEQGKLVVHVFAKLHIVLDELARELFKLPADRQQHDGRDQAEHRVHVRNAAGGQDLIPQRVEHAEAVQEHQSHNNEDRARDVKEDMDHARALGVSLGADGANDGGRDAVADVDADDDGVNGRKCQRAGRGDGLQNADGGR